MNSDRTVSNPTLYPANNQGQDSTIARPLRSVSDILKDSLVTTGNDEHHTAGGAPLPEPESSAAGEVRGMAHPLDFRDESREGLIDATPPDEANAEIIEATPGPEKSGPSSVP